MARAIVLNDKDTVATLIEAGRAHEACPLQGARPGSVHLLADVPFGHKVAIKDMAAGADVVKYGQVIGATTAPIKTGEHVHVHNVGSKRGRGDLARKEG